MTDEVWWLVKALLNYFLVEAGSVDQARAKALKDLGYEHKPYVGREWEIRPATDEDKTLYVAFPRPTASPSPPSRPPYARHARRGSPVRRMT